MAAFLNNCRFIPTAGGTTDWVYASPVGGCQSPSLAGAVDGRKYKFLAISSDLTQWEIAEGAYIASSGTFARAIVLYNSSGSGTAAGQGGAGTKINFATVPNVAIVGIKEDLLSPDETNGFTAAQMAQMRANLGVTKRNYIVNPGMQVSQENGTTTIVSGYPADQYLVPVAISAGAVTVAQVASPTPGGSSHRIRFTCTGANPSPGAGDYVLVEHRLEGLRVADLRLGSASARTVTFQFGCKGPAGTYGVTFRNAGYSRVHVATFTITAGEANTDTVKAVSLTLDQSGTWATDSTMGLEVDIVLTVGTTYQGATNTWVSGSYFGAAGQSNFMATSGNVMELFDWSLVEGTAAPPFQLPDYASELLACKRYYYRSVPPARGIVATTSSVVRLGCAHPVQMRTTPILAIVGSPAVTDNVAATTIASIVNNYSTPDAVEFDVATASATLTVGRMAMTYQGSPGTISVNARL